MNAFADQLLVGTALASALAFFLVRALRRRSPGKKPCETGCGCATAAARKHR
jgi:hypothetical protein